MTPGCVKVTMKAPRGVLFKRKCPMDVTMAKPGASKSWHEVGFIVQKARVEVLTRELMCVLNILITLKAERIS